MTGMRETHSQQRREASKDEAIVGDVAILKDDTMKQVFWKLAVIEKLLTGKDGQAQAAMVKVVNSDGRQTRLRHSLKHLIHLEVQSEGD